jgi:AhpD family alkylhydroperoxidase
MHNRIEWAKHAPEAYKAMVGLEQALAKSGLESSLLELIRLRASQINGCAYCVNLHANDARKAGETEARLQTLCVWRETATSPRVNVRRWPGSKPDPPAREGAPQVNTGRTLRAGRSGEPDLGDRHHQCLEPLWRGFAMVPA